MKILKKREVPAPLLADAYTVSSPAFASDGAQQYSSYNITNRYSPVKAWPDLAKDSRMVLYGVEHFIEHYLTRRVTYDDVKNARRFMNRAHSFGGPLPFNDSLWNSIVDKHGGYLPVKLSSLPDGSTFFPNEPAVRVDGKDGYGEIAGYVESRALGAISIGTAAATLCRHWRERLREEVEIDLRLLGRTISKEAIEAIVQWQVHNFGCRACASVEESILIGRAHLLSFNGTDNFDAAYMAFEDGCPESIGTSIVALAHRNVLSFKQEDASWEKIIESTKKDKIRVVSCVADTYNYQAAVERLVKLAIKYPEVIVVIRPDSGDAYQVLIEIFSVCIALNCVKTEGRYTLPLNVRFIYGDSVKPKVQLEVMNRLRVQGMLPTLWGIWGVGGFIRNNSLRDSLSSAYKLGEYGEDNWVVKLSEVEAKMSIPGCNNIYVHSNKLERYVGPYCESPGWDNLTKVYYDNGDFQFDYSWPHHSLEEFDSYKTLARLNPSYGLNRESLSNGIISFQNDIFKRHRETLVA